VERVRAWAEMSLQASGHLGVRLAFQCRLAAPAQRLLLIPIEQSHERTRQDPPLASNGRLGVLVCALGLAAALPAPRSRGTTTPHKSHHSDRLPGHRSSPGSSCKRAYPYLRIVSNPVGADLVEGIVSAEGGRWNKRCICIVSYYHRSPSLFRRVLIWGVRRLHYPRFKVNSPKLDGDSRISSSFTMPLAETIQPSQSLPSRENNEWVPAPQTTIRLLFRIHHRRQIWN